LLIFDGVNYFIEAEPEKLPASIDRRTSPVLLF
jgi:hypothetical protein